MGEEELVEGQDGEEKVKRIETTEFKRQRRQAAEEDVDTLMAEEGFRFLVQEEDGRGGLIRRWEGLTPITIQEIHNRVGEGTFQVRKIFVEGKKRLKRAEFKLRLGPLPDGPPISGIQGDPYQGPLGNPQALAGLLTPFLQLIEAGFTRMETAIKDSKGGGGDAQAMQFQAMQAQLQAQSSIVQPLFSFLGEKQKAEGVLYSRGQKDAQDFFKDSVALLRGQEEEEGANIIELFQQDPKKALAEIQRDPALLGQVKELWESLKGIFDTQEEAG